MGSPSYGVYLVPFVTRRLQILFPSVKSPVERLRDGSIAFTEQGYFGSSWATAMITLRTEFGSVGAILLCGLFGILSSKAVVLYRCEGSFVAILGIVCLGIVGATFPMQLPLAETPMFVFILMVLLFLRVDRPKRYSHGLGFSSLFCWPKRCNAPAASESNG